jgi:hypothetical protein
MTLRCTASGVPAMRAPAAAGWPPPPNCAADFVHVHVRVFGAQADARQLRPDLFETHATTTGSIARMWSIRPSVSLLSAPVRARSDFFSQK